MGDTLELLSRIAGDAVGLDLSPTAVAACRARGLRAMEGNLLDHPHVYDLVFSDGMIEHFEDFRPYLAGLCRLSRRYVMIAQTNHSSLLIKTSLLLERLLKPKVNVREYPHRLSAFIDECSSHSFSLVGRGSILLGGLKVLLFEKADSNTFGRASNGAKSKFFTRRNTARTDRGRLPDIHAAHMPDCGTAAQRCR
jgi:SAM-dependent methyltransferase